MPHHDLIGIGGSADSLPALTEVLKDYVPDHNATLFVVLHRIAGSSHLANAVQRATSMHVCEPAVGAF